MTQTILIIISIFFLSCNSNQARNQASVSEETNDTNSRKVLVSEIQNKKESVVTADTTSSEYLIYLLKNEKPFNSYWTKRLGTLNGLFYVPEDSLTRVSLIRDWVINDSISVIIFSNSGGTSYDEFLITLKNKHDLVSSIHISDNADSDLSPDNPYFYTQYNIINDKTIKLFNHKITGTEGADEKDRLISIETFTIQNNGKVIKK